MSALPTLSGGISTFLAVGQAGGGGGGGGGGPTTVTELLSGTDSAYFTPWDLSTLWQDAAGTTPVTTHNDPVGRMDDVSGNGNHALQSNTSLRPLYQTDGSLHWIECSVSNNWFDVTSLALGETWTHVGAWRVDNIFDYLFCTTDTVGQSGFFADGSNLLTAFDSSAANQNIGDGTRALTTKRLATIVRKSASAMYGRVDGVAGSSFVPNSYSGETQGLALFTNINTGPNQVLDGRFFGGLWTAQELDASGIALAETEIGTEAGVPV